MLKPAGIIQRIAREPVIRLEYLTTDDLQRARNPASWSDQEAAAFFFDDYHDADKLATLLGGRPIFAITRPQRRPTPERETVAINGELIEIAHAAHHSPSRKRRAKREITGAVINLEGFA
jgi:hypothetical protein